MRAEASAGAKCILCGEHFVVHGVPCVAFPVREVKVRVQLLEKAKNPVTLHFTPEVAEQLSPNLFDAMAASVQRLTEKLCTELQAEIIPRLGVEIFGNIPLSQGLGSSAAFSVAMLRAFSSLFEKKLSIEDNIRLSLSAEKLFHTSPSGVDNSTILMDNPIIFRSIHNYSVIRPQKTLYFVIGSVGMRERTSHVIAQVSAWKESHGTEFLQMCSKVSELSEKAAIAVEMGDVIELGRILNENHAILTHLGVSTPALEDAVGAARQCGALGAKLTGAGAGGCIVALVYAHQVETLISTWKSLHLPWIQPVALNAI